MLDALRERVSGDMSPKRYRHTAEVEKMVARLAALYAPEKENILRAAALLHDTTKEKDSAWHLELCKDRKIELDRDAPFAPKTLHAITAAALIPERFPELADEEIISCVRWHTTGREGMTLCEKLVYLADYIDMSRTFEDCVRLRNYFFSVPVEAMSDAERLVHLDSTLILSYSFTINGLLEDELPISKHTIEARNELIRQQRS